MGLDLKKMVSFTTFWFPLQIRRKSNTLTFMEVHGLFKSLKNYFSFEKLNLDIISINASHFLFQICFPFQIHLQIQLSK